MMQDIVEIKETKKQIIEGSHSPYLSASSSSTTTINVSQSDRHSILPQLQASLYEKYRGYFNLERLFDEGSVPISESFINLSLIKEETARENEQKLKGSDDKKAGDEKSNQFKDERLFSHEQLYTVAQPLPLDQLFEAGEDKAEPKKILMFGRAGIGKSTFCQLLATQSVMREEKQKKAIGRQLQKRFEVVFWIRLREIVELSVGESKLADIVHRFCLDQEGRENITVEALNDYITKYANRILFILDGFDEISEQLTKSEYRGLNLFLESFTAKNRQVLLTSRPMTIDRLGAQKINFDCRVENMGFSNQNIEEYVNRFLKEKRQPEKSKTFIDFLEARPSLWGTAHIPINLELMSWLYTKGELDFGARENVTLSALYQKIVTGVLSAYAKKQLLGQESKLEKTLSQRASSQTMASLIECFLERLAYDSMMANQLLIEKALVSRALKSTLKEAGLPEDMALQEELLKSAIQKQGFLMTTRRGGQLLLDQAPYFIHLSFQEFYAALFIKRQLVDHSNTEASQVILETIRLEKYTPHFQLMWWLTAGLLYQSGANALGESGRETKESKSPNLSLVSTTSGPWSPLLNFWKAILTEPRDYAGYHHLLLIARCLDECEADERLPMHQALLQQQLAWLKFYMKVGWSGREYVEQWSQCLSLCRLKIIEALFVKALEDKDHSIFSFAGEILGKLSPSSDQVVKSLLVAQRDENISVRYAAVKALGGISNPSESVVEGLLAALREEDSYFRLCAARALCKVSNPGELVVEGLLAALKGDDSRVQQAVVEVLGKLSNPSERVMEGLLAALKDGDEDVQQAVVEVLGKLSNPSERVVEGLLAALKDGDRDVQQAVVEVLGKLSNPSERVVEVLLAALKDGDRDVQQAVVEVLGKLSNPSEQMVESLLEAQRRIHLRNFIDMLSDEDDENISFRRGVARALWNASNPSQQVVGELLAGLRDEDRDVRRLAAEALKKVSNPSERVLEGLLAALRDEDRDVRRLAVEALEKVSNPSERVLEGLLAALRDEDRGVRWSAAQALGDLSNPSEKVVEGLLAALMDGDWNVLRPAARALGGSSSLVQSQLLFVLRNNPAVFKRLISFYMEEDALVSVDTSKKHIVIRYDRNTIIVSFASLTASEWAIIPAIFMAIAKERDRPVDLYSVSGYDNPDFALTSSRNEVKSDSDRCTVTTLETKPLSGNPDDRQQWEKLDEIKETQSSAVDNELKHYPTILHSNSNTLSFDIVETKQSNTNKDVKSLPGKNDGLLELANESYKRWMFELPTFEQFQAAEQTIEASKKVFHSLSERRRLFRSPGDNPQFYWATTAQTGEVTRILLFECYPNYERGQLRQSEGTSDLYDLNPVGAELVERCRYYQKAHEIKAKSEDIRGVKGMKNLFGALCQENVHQASLIAGLRIAQVLVQRGYIDFHLTPEDDTKAFYYLHHVLREVERHRFSKLTPQLPKTLIAAAENLKKWFDREILQKLQQSLFKTRSQTILKNLEKLLTDGTAIFHFEQYYHFFQSVFIAIEAAELVLPLSKVILLHSVTQNISEDKTDRFRSSLSKAIDEAFRPMLGQNQISMLTERIFYLIKNLHHSLLEKRRAANLLIFYKNELNECITKLEERSKKPPYENFYQAAVVDCRRSVQQCDALALSLEEVKSVPEVKAKERMAGSDWESREKLWDQCRNALIEERRGQNHISRLQAILTESITKWFVVLCQEVERQLGAPPCAFAIFLSGSYARGEPTLGSDLDIGFVTEIECEDDDYFPRFFDLLLWKISVMPTNMLSIEHTEIEFVRNKRLFGTPEQFAERYFFLPKDDRAQMGLPPEAVFSRYPAFVYTSQHEKYHQQAQAVVTKYQGLLKTFLNPETKEHKEANSKPYQQIATWALRQRLSNEVKALSEIHLRKAGDQKEEKLSNRLPTVNLKNVLSPLTNAILAYGCYVGLTDIREPCLILDALQTVVTPPFLPNQFLTQLEYDYRTLLAWRFEKYWHQLHYSGPRLPLGEDELFLWSGEASQQAELKIMPREYCLTEDETNQLTRIQTTLVEVIINSVEAFEELVSNEGVQTGRSGLTATPCFSPREAAIQTTLIRANALSPDQRKPHIEWIVKMLGYCIDELSLPLGVKENFNKIKGFPDRLSNFVDIVCKVEVITVDVFGQLLESMMTRVSIGALTGSAALYRDPSNSETTAKKEAPAHGPTDKLPDKSTDTQKCVLM